MSLSERRVASLLQEKQELVNGNFSHEKAIKLASVLAELAMLQSSNSNHKKGASDATETPCNTSEDVPW